LREPRQFVFPRDRTWPRWWLVASVLAHAVVLWGVVESSLTPPRERASNPLLLLSVPSGRPPAEAIVLQGAPMAPRMRGRAAGVPLANAPLAPAGRDTTPAAIRLGAGGRDTTAATGRGPRAGRGAMAYAPQLGNGLLWVRPLVGLTLTSRPIRLDSAVAVRMLALADSVQKHPPSDPNANPYVSRPWTFRVGGKTYGIDSKGIHLGDFTIPTAVLAFLSMPQGNIDQARANRAFMEMRADMLRAAARAQAEDDFRQAVRDLRARKDKERDDGRARQGEHPVVQP
jgi:hypothetical protein